MRLKSFFLVLLLAGLSLNLSAQGLKSFKLQNGLQVYVWEDSTQADVFGMVAVRAGAVDDPAEYTGLAHYLEHLMFKGTQMIGAHNWAEERLVYDSIVAKFDERAEVTDPEKRRAIDLEINRLTTRQAALSNQNEFGALVQNLGGDNLNAATSYDYTQYFNSFPKNELPRWLELYSTRFINPVFRSFQTELETVYEEYNMYQDDPTDRYTNVLLKQLFKGHPYSRPLIGLQEHLKNPQISKLIEFYETWYVPGNMALILVGDVKTEEVANLINAKFSRLAAGTAPQPKEYEIAPIVGRTQIKEEVGSYPRLIIGYEGVETGHPDELALEVVTNLLSNRSQTGLLDKLALDGEVMVSSAFPVSFSDYGRTVIEVIPKYDYNQRRFESHRFVEKLVLEEVSKLSEGKIDKQLLETVKNSLVRSNMRLHEYNQAKANLISEAFISGSSLDMVLNYPELVKSITLEDVQRVAKKYLNDNFLALHISASDDHDVEKLNKPDLPLVPVSSASEKSYYANLFTKIPVSEPDVPTVGFDDVKTGTINEKSKLFYYPNPVNDIFTMTIRYGIGTREMPDLEYAVQLMNDAGVLGNYTPQEFRMALSEVNATISYRVDEDYLYVSVEGSEANMVDVCGLMTRQILMPDLDEKQLDNLKGSAYQGRLMEKEVLDIKEEAMTEFLVYGDKSSYIDRKPLEDVLKMTFSDLSKSFQEATNYSAEIFYTGQLPFETVHQLLNTHLPLKETELESSSPKEMEIKKYNENQVFVYHDPKAKQSRIVFYTDGPVTTPAKEALVFSFNPYFGAGFTALVPDRIRVQNSMAYTSVGIFRLAEISQNPSVFYGFIGTQGDKTNRAIDLFMDLVRDMPENEYRMSDIKNYLVGSTIGMKPHFRNFAMVCENWKLRGYEQILPKELLPVFEEMEFADIVEFYEQNLKDKPIVIGIVGNTGDFDLKALDKYGEVERVRDGDLFKD